MATAPALFISDLHLSPDRPAIADLFGRFLVQAARSAQALFILGDLFDYWVGDDDIAAPFNAQICAALAALPIPHYLVRGNRDLLLGEAFAQATHSILLPDTSVHDIAGVPTLLLHGDTLCTDDIEYQAFRRQVHDPRWQQSFLAQPLAERHRQIEALRRQSESTKRVKADYLMDTNREAVADAFRHHDVRRMIHGHTHRLARHAEDDVAPGCERYVLGEWHDNGNVLRIDDAGCRFETLSTADQIMALAPSTANSQRAPQ